MSVKAGIAEAQITRRSFATSLNRGALADIESASGQSLHSSSAKENRKRQKRRGAHKNSRHGRDIRFDGPDPEMVRPGHHRFARAG